MKNLDLFNTLHNYIDVKVKICNNITHPHNWSESGYKVDYDIWIILDGTVRVILEGKEYTACANDIIFFYPETIYKAFTCDQSCTFIYIHFDFTIGNCARGLDELLLSGYIPGQRLVDEIKSFIDCYWLYKVKEPLSFLTLKGHLIILISRLIMHQYNNINQSDRKNKQSKKILRLYPALNHITNHFYEPLYISELARLCLMSEKYFITVFKNTINISPVQYITQLKMNKALEYLYEQKYSVKEIAAMLGYSDQYTFSKAFKKYYRFAPSKYLSY